jgi:hypothetical protein
VVFPRRWVFDERLPLKSSSPRAASSLSFHNDPGADMESSHARARGRPRLVNFHLLIALTLLAVAVGCQLPRRDDEAEPRPVPTYNPDWSPDLDRAAW